MTSDRRARCYLGLGSNLGNRLANLQDALRRLEPEFHVTSVSPLYESDPVGPAGQPPYFNAACAGETILPPRALLDYAKSIEWALGRRPGARWGPRPLDVDILLYDEQSLDTASLTVPHPRIMERAFVLAPLAALAPTLRLANGMTVTDALGGVQSASPRRLAGPGWADALSVAR